MTENKKQKERGFSIILRHLKPHKKTLIVLSVLSVISAGANATVPYLAGRLIDHLITASGVFFVVLGVWAVLKLVADGVDWKIAKMSSALQRIVMAEYVSRGFGKLLELPMKFHKNRRIGEIGNKIDNSADHLSNIISEIIVDLFPQFLSIVFALSIVFVIEYRLGFILMASIFIYALILIRAASPIVAMLKRAQRANHDAYSNAYDIISNVEAVKQAITEDREQRRLYRDMRLKTAPLWINVIHIWQNLSFWQRIIISAVQGVIFLISFFFVRDGTMSVGGLVAVNGYAAMVFGPFVILARNWHSVQHGITSLEFSERMLSTPPEVYKPERGVYLDKIKGDITFKNVSFRYATNQPWVLKNISFHVAQGEKVALVGKSGEGKSTLADLISCMYHPAKGSVRIDGVDAKRLDLKKLRSSIAVVPQEVVLFNDTVKNNIRYGKWNTASKEVEEAAQLAHAHDFIQKFPKKYDQMVGERGVKLSVGQKQRIAIARAILRDPAILLLDEPTSALDAESERVIQTSLEKLMEGRTTLVIAHRLSTVKKADRILVLEGGEIVEQGTHAELM
ncbi:MAG: ABC transporter ATP-binding protein, partial [bacterium]|nr:ABC transporter ATP-binding protein [bacterium]